MAIVLVITSLACYTLNKIVRETNQSIVSAKARLREIKVTASNRGFEKSKGKIKKAYELILKSKANFLQRGTKLKLIIMTSGGKQFKNFITDEFKKNSDVIFWSQPMKMVERMNDKWHGNDLVQFDQDPFKTLLGNENHDGFDNSLEFFQEIMSCKFTLKMTNFVKRFLKRCPDMLNENTFLQKALKCSSKNSTWECSKATDTLHKRMNSVCRERNFNVVVYANEERMAAIKHLVERLRDGFNVLHLVQDPRATVYEFSMQGRIERNPFFTEVQEKIGFVCEHLVENARYGMKMRSDKYTLFRYEDFKTRNDLRRLLNITAKAGEVEQLDHAGWRAEMNQEFSSTVEDICFPAMEELGYRYLNGEEIRGKKESFLKVVSEQDQQDAVSLLSIHHAI